MAARRTLFPPARRLTTPHKPLLISLIQACTPDPGRNWSSIEVANLPVDWAAMSTTQIQLPDGQLIYARVSGQVPSAGRHDIAFAEAIPKLASEQLTKLAEGEGVATKIREAVSHFDADEVSIDFGIEFTGKTGRVIGVLAEVGGTASIVLHLIWQGGKGSASQK